MSIVSLTCTKCGAAVEYDNRKEIGKCPFCGTKYKNVQDVHNTIINHTTQVVRNNSGTEMDYEQMIANMEALLAVGQFSIASKILEKLLEEKSQDYRVWIGYITFELSQFDRRYEDKTKVYTPDDVNTSRIVAQLKANRNKPEYYHLFPDRLSIIEHKHREFQNFIEFAERAKDFTDNLADPNKKDFHVLDEIIYQALNGMLAFASREQIGDFIICKETLENGLVGYSYCYFGDSDKIVLPNLFNEQKIKLNRVYIASSIKNYKIYIPKEVEIIESGAFSCCDEAKEIVIPSRKINIKSNAFNNCMKLDTIRISSIIETIQENAFCGCENFCRLVYNFDEDEMNSHTIEILNDVICKPDIYGSDHILVFQLEGLKKLPKKMFFNNQRITHLVTKNNNTVKISRKDFFVVLGEEVQEFEEQVFAQCNKLRVVDIFSDTIVVGDECFLNCDSLENCQISSSNLAIGKFVFKGINKKGVIKIKTTKRGAFLDSMWKSGSKAKFEIIY